MTILRKAFLGASVVVGVVTSRAELTWDRHVIEQAAAYGDSKVEVPFTFKNTGDHPVTVLKVDTSCSCTTAELEKKVYQPGEAGGIVAIFTLGDRKGLQEKQVLVTTSDDPAKPVVLTLKVKIPAGATISANKLNWTKGAVPEEKTLALTVQPGTKIELEQLTPAQSKLFYVEVAEDPETKGYKLKARPLSTANAVQCPLRIKAVSFAREGIDSTNHGQSRRSSVHRGTLVVILRID